MTKSHDIFRLPFVTTQTIDEIESNDIRLRLKVRYRIASFGSFSSISIGLILYK